MRGMLLTIVIGMILIAATTLLAAELDRIASSDPILTTATIERTLTYQGLLKNGSGDPVPDASYNITFRLYNVASGGSALWNSGTIAVTTSDGYFTRELGPINLPFNRPYYLSLQVASDAEMTARHKVTMTAYSAVSDTANYAFRADTSRYAFSSSTYWTLNDSVLTTSRYWGLLRGGAGNAILGNNAWRNVNIGAYCTTGVAGNNNSYNTIAGGYRNRIYGSYSFVGGGYLNRTDSIYSAITGGYQNSAVNDYVFVGGGNQNVATGDYSVISGGYINEAFGINSTVGGGRDNSARGNFSTIGGGQGNYADSNQTCIAGGNSNGTHGPFTAIGGGGSNDAYDNYGVIAGGGSNNLHGNYSSIGGGCINSTDSSYSAIAGGYQNHTYNRYATIGGGSSNSAIGAYSFVGGGTDNSAGAAAVVGGGVGNHADSQFTTIAGGWGNNALEYSSCIAGGMTNVTRGHFASIGGGIDNYVGGDYSVIPGGYADTVTSLANHSMVFGDNVYCSAAYRVYLFNSGNPGRLALNRDSYSGGAGHPIHVGTDASNGNGAYLTGGGVWTNGSSRTFKENFVPYNGAELLAKISNLSLTSYNYLNSTEKHFGPVAEEFVGAFDTGVIREDDGKRDDKYLSSGDVAGVALAGVQELLKIIEKQNLKIEKLENEIYDLKAQAK